MVRSRRRSPTPDENMLRSLDKKHRCLKEIIRCLEEIPSRERKQSKIWGEYGRYLKWYKDLLTDCKEARRRKHFRDLDQELMDGDKTIKGILKHIQELFDQEEKEISRDDSPSPSKRPKKEFIPPPVNRGQSRSSSRSRSRTPPSRTSSRTRSDRSYSSSGSRSRSRSLSRSQSRSRSRSPNFRGRRMRSPVERGTGGMRGGGGGPHGRRRRRGGRKVRERQERARRAAEERTRRERNHSPRRERRRPASDSDSHSEDEPTHTDRKKNNVLLQNLPEKCTEKVVELVVRKFGNVESIRMRPAPFVDDKTGERPNGAQVLFATRESAEACIEALNNAVVAGQTIKAMINIPNSERKRQPKRRSRSPRDRRDRRRSSPHDRDDRRQQRDGFTAAPLPLTMMKSGSGGDSLRRFKKESKTESLIDSLDRRVARSLKTRSPSPRRFRDGPRRSNSPKRGRREPLGAYGSVVDGAKYKKNDTTESLIDSLDNMVSSQVTSREYWTGENKD